ncbi:MAG: glycosyltransferase [Dysgonamonadaceae bacterium]|jgi:glycosyltransferase involved in cell wall biosynthesis|nr:glycosyltransferase [Dysgonamonadaceae bacterium]
MIKEPVVSVVIPVYNGEQYVKSCLDDMMSQTYKNLDIMVIDDGSTDKSADIAREYPIRLIQHEKNRGLSAARNTGIDATKGEYIHFMDVDDGINPCYYEKMVAAITETDADVACSGIINEPKPHRTMLYDEQKVFSGIDDKLKITNVGKWGFSVRYLFKVEFLKKHHLRFEEGRLIEDLPFSLPAVYFAEKLVVVPGAVYTYILRENSIMTRKDKKHRQKRHTDRRYAMEFRHHFARQHHFKIPGVPTGRFSLFFVKWFT